MWSAAKILRGLRSQVDRTKQHLKPCPTQGAIKNSSGSLRRVCVSYTVQPRISAGFRLTHARLLDRVNDQQTGYPVKYVPIDLY
jgi:hypothetical protein